MKKMVSTLLVVCVLLSCFGTAFAARETATEYYETVDGIYYDGTYQTPEPEVKTSSGTLMRKDIDYVLTYKNNKDVGEAEVIIDGKGDFDGYHQVLKFNILPRPIYMKVNDQTFDSRQTEINFDYTITGGSLVDGESLGEPEYSVVGVTTDESDDGSITRVSKVTVSFPDAPNYAAIVTTGEIVEKYNSSDEDIKGWDEPNKTDTPTDETIGDPPLSEGDFTIKPINDVVYSGAYQTPVVIVTDEDGNKLVNGLDYTLAFEDNKDAGTATVTATGINDFKGMTGSRTFNITKRDVTVDVDNVTVNYGESYAIHWKVSEGLVKGDVLPTPDLDLPNSAQPAGEYPISVSFPACNNYNITVNGGVLTVVDKDGKGNTDNEVTGGGVVKVTASCTEGGTVSPTGETEVMEGKPVVFTVAPEFGYQIKAVYVNDELVDSADAYSIPDLGAENTIYVEFERKSDDVLITDPDDGGELETADKDSDGDDAAMKPDVKPDEKPNGKADAATPETWTNKFTDVSAEDWFYEYVEYTNSNGLLIGISDTEFAPDMSLTRAMVVTALHRVEGTPYVSKGTQFKDIDANTYYYEALKWAAAAKIVIGVGDNNFAPDRPVTREELALMLYRYAQYKDYEVSKTVSMDKYSDSKDISDFAKDAMTWCCAEGLIIGKGDNVLAPVDAATRAEVATTLTRLCKNILDYDSKVEFADADGEGLALIIHA